MADTVNFSTAAATLGVRGGAYTEVLTGEKTGESYLSVDTGEIEWVEAAGSSTPAVGLVGNRMLEGEQQIWATVTSGQAIFARSRTSQGAKIAVTPASA